MSIKDHKWLFIIVFLLIISFLVLPVSAISATIAQNDAYFEKIKNNVIKLTANFPDGIQPESGFGFVVGKRQGTLYVATAKHVVMQIEESIPATSVTATFYHARGKPIPIKDVTVLNIKRDDLDLALLEIRKPIGFKLKSSYFSSRKVKRGDDVWFIGREGKWRVPAREGRVSENPKSDGKINFEISTVKSGTSGAPLVTENGIVGLIIKDHQYDAIAISLEIIEEFASNFGYPFLNTSPAPVTFQKPIHSANASPTSFRILGKYYHNGQLLRTKKSWMKIKNPEESTLAELILIDQSGKFGTCRVTEEGMVKALAKDSDLEGNDDGGSIFNVDDISNAKHGSMEITCEIIKTKY